MKLFCHWRRGQIRWRVCQWQAFPALSNICTCQSLPTIRCSTQLCSGLFLKYLIGLKKPASGRCSSTCVFLVSDEDKKCFMTLKPDQLERKLLFSAHFGKHSLKSFFVWRTSIKCWIILIDLLSQVEHVSTRVSRLLLQMTNVGKPLGQRT